jgi:hypothetical protein
LGILRLRKGPLVSRESLLSERLSATLSHRSPEAILTPARSESVGDAC